MNGRNKILLVLVIAVWVAYVGAALWPVDVEGTVIGKEDRATGFLVGQGHPAYLIVEDENGDIEGVEVGNEFYTYEIGEHFDERTTFGATRSGEILRPFNFLALVLTISFVWIVVLTRYAFILSNLE